MSNPSLDHLIPDFGDYSPDDIWSQPAVPAAPAEPAPASTEKETPSQRARREARETFGEALRRYSKTDDAPSLSPSLSQPQDETVPAAIGVSSPEDRSADIPQRPKTGLVIPLFCDHSPLPEETASAGESTTAEDLPKEELHGAAATSENAAAPQNDASEENTEPVISRPRHKDRNSKEKTDTPSFKERFLTPVLFFFASILSRREMQRLEAARWPDPQEEPLPPEAEPKKAAKFYGAQAKPLRLRCRLSLVLTLVLTWISLQLPMAGLLGKSLQAQSGVCLLLTLAVMLLALDVITTGFRQLLDLHPGAESLASLAALLCCVDGALVLAGYGDALPYSAAACLSISAALWGQRLTCSARRRTFLAATRTDVTVMSSKEGNHDTPARLLRAPLEEQSIVRRTESEDIAQSVYTAAAPILMLAALILSIVASLNGQAVHFLHMLSALITVSSAISAFFFFSLPYALAARRLLASGAALLGWAGIEEMGRRPTLVITDEDIFPPDDDILQGRIHFSSIYLPEEVPTSTILSYTCSIMAAAEGGLSRPFLTLAKTRHIPLVEVEDFAVRDSGGYSAVIEGNTVLVGCYGFMKLMGVSIPPKLIADTALYTAVHGEMAASFLMEYSPTSNVQNALVTLLRGRSRATFALQNFCITPRVLGRMFRLSPDRLAISSSFIARCKQAKETTRPNTAAALYSLSHLNALDGLMSAVDLSETGRRLYSACRISSFITLASSVLGMLILFLLFRAGAFAPASAGNLALYMALWALPVVILSVGQSR